MRGSQRKFSFEEKLRLSQWQGPRPGGDIGQAGWWGRGASYPPCLSDAPEANVLDTAMLRMTTMAKQANGVSLVPTDLSGFMLTLRLSFPFHIVSLFWAYFTSVDQWGQKEVEYSLMLPHPVPTAVCAS